MNKPDSYPFEGEECSTCGGECEREALQLQREQGYIYAAFTHPEGRTLALSTLGAFLVDLTPDSVRGYTVQELRERGALLQEVRV